MKCTKIEKWLSDSIDGELSERKRGKVESHLQKCSHCRSYKMTLEKIHGAVRKLDKGKVSNDYWEDFTLKIKKKISSFEPERGKYRPFVWGWRWAWIGIGFILFLVIGISIIQFTNKKAQEVFIFSFEDTIEQVYKDIGNNSELEDIFNLVIIDSIGEYLKGPKEEMAPGFYNLSSPWEDFSEEELVFLDSEIKNEIKS